MKTKYNYTHGEIIHTRDGRKTLLTYLSEAGLSPSRKRMVNVSCSCSKKWSVQLVNVLNGSTVCCGKYPCRTYKSLYEGRRDPEVGYRALMYVYKKHAKERNLDFLLTYDQFKALLKQNCYYCNQPPSQVYKLTKKGTDEVRAGVPVTYNGIDRIDSNGHYTACNVVTACKRCNVAKMDQTFDEYINRVRSIYNHLNLKENVASPIPCNQFS